MKNFLKGLGTTVVVLGIIGTIVLAVKFGVDVVEGDYDKLLKTVKMIEKRNWLTTICICAGGLLSTVILSSILYGLSEILETMERQSNSIKEIQTKVRNIENKEKGGN